MARSNRGPGSRGTGKAGGGLQARIKAHEVEAPSGYVKNGNGVPNMRHHRPGSQNPRKGGLGKG